MTSHNPRNTPTAHSHPSAPPIANPRDNVHRARISPIARPRRTPAPNARARRPRAPSRARRMNRESHPTARSFHARVGPVSSPTRATNARRPPRRDRDRDRAISPFRPHRRERRPTTTRRRDARADAHKKIYRRTWTLVALKAATRPTKEEARRADIVLVCRNGAREARGGRSDRARGSRRDRPHAPTDDDD